MHAAVEQKILVIPYDLPYVDCGSCGGEARRAVIGGLVCMSRQRNRIESRHARGRCSNVVLSTCCLRRHACLQAGNQLPRDAPHSIESNVGCERDNMWRLIEVSAPYAGEPPDRQQHDKASLEALLIKLGSPAAKRLQEIAEDRRPKRKKSIRRGGFTATLLLLLLLSSQRANKQRAGPIRIRCVCKTIRAAIISAGDVLRYSSLCRPSTARARTPLSSISHCAYQSSQMKKQTNVLHC